MPSSLFEIEDEEEEFTEEDDPSVMDASSNPSSNNNSFPSDLSSHLQKMDTSKLDKGISFKTASFLVINCNDFNLLMNKISARDIIDIHSRYIDSIVTIIKKYKGQADSFAGDKIYASWNTVKVYRGNHSFAACMAAINCIEKIAIMNEELSNSELPPLTIRAAVTTGNALSGIMGSESMKIFTSISDHVTMAYKLEAHNKKLGTSVLITDSVYQYINKAIGTEFRARPVDVVRLSKRAVKERTVIYELTSMKSKFREHWMYDYEKQELDELYKEYSGAFDYFVNGECEKADQILLEYNRRVIRPDPIATRLQSKLQKRRYNATDAYEHVLM
jgi:class 3 adenylate cyclase